MSNNVKAKKRLTQFIIAVVVLCMTVTGVAFLMKDVVPDASAATYTYSAVNSTTTWNTAVSGKASGSVVNITLSGDIAATAKMTAIPAGVTVNLNMNGHNIYWDDVRTAAGDGFMSTSYTSGDYASGTYWGLITNNGTLSITGTGTIRSKHVAYNMNPGSTQRGDYVQRAAAISNGTGTLTIGSGITVESYLDMIITDGSKKQMFLYNCAIYNGNGGTVNSSANITAGSQATAQQASADMNTYCYSISYGIYGGNVKTSGGNINVTAYAGASSRTGVYAWGGLQSVSIGIGIYSNSAKVLGDTTIKTLTNSWESTSGNSFWENDGCDISFSVGVMYLGTNYPVIGASTDIEATFTHNSGDGTQMVPPGLDSSVYYTGQCDNSPNEYARRAYSVVGVTQNVNTIGIHTSKKTWDSDGGFFGTGSSATGETTVNNMNTYHNFNANMKYYAEDPYYDTLTGSTYLIDALSTYQKESGANNAESKTSSIKNGVPGTSGTQYLIMYRYYEGTKSAANLTKVAYSYDSTIQSTRGYINIAGSRAYTGVIADASSNITFGGGGISRNSYYYEFLGAYIEKVAPATYANRNIDTLSSWSATGTALTSAGTTLTTSQTLIVYLDYVLKDPSSVRVAAANAGTAINQYTTSTDFTVDYTGKALVPGTDFNIGIIDMGADDTVSLNNTDDDTIVTSVYDITGGGSGSGSNATAVTYRYTTDASPSETTTWVSGLPKDAGSYVIEVKVNADTTYGYSNTYNRLGTIQYLTCTINKADVTVTGSSAKTGIYGSTLAELVPFSDFTVTGKGSDSVSGAWSFAGDYTTTDYIGAGSYNLTLVWTPTAGSASEKNYNATTYAVTLVVNKRNVTVNVGEAKAGYGDESVVYTLAYSNLAACDLAKTTDWEKATTGEIYYNDAWIEYYAGVEIGTYDARIKTFGGAGDANNNFTLNTQLGTLEVGKRILRYTAVATDRVYEPNNYDVDVVLTYMSGAYGNDYIQTVINTTGTMTTPNAGENKAVTVDVNNIVSNVGSNYQIVVDNASALTVNITKADPVGVSCKADPETLVYDSTRTLASVAIAKVDTAVAGTWAWENASIVPTCDVKSYTAVFTPTDTNNYNTLTQPVSLNITQKEVIVSVPVQNITYGDSVPALAGSISYQGFTGNDSMDTVPTTGGTEVTTTYTRGSAAGSYPVTVVTNLAATNYLFVAQNSTIEVGKKDLTITSNPVSIVYGQSTPDLTVSILTATGFYGSENLASLSGTPIISTTYAVGKSIGEYPINIAGYTSNNYNIQYVPGTLTVTKAVLTVTPVAQSVTYGADAPAYAADKLYTIAGYVAGDTASSVAIDGAPVFVTSYQSGKNAGVYPVTVDVSQMSAANYSFSGVEGTLTVNKATPSITLEPSASIVHAQTYAEAVFTDDAIVVNPNSGASVAGTFSLVDQTAVINYGQGVAQQVEAVFTPADDLNYTTVTLTIWIDVNQKQITGNPIIKGSPMIGETLTADLSAMDPANTQYYNYQWYRNDAPISGAVNSTYVVGDADLGSQIHVVVTAIDSTGYVGSAASAKTSSVIKKLTPASAAQIDFTVPADTVYDGQTHAATAEVKSEYAGYVGEVTIKYNGSSTLPKNAGTYIVTVDIATPSLISGDSDYTDSYYGPVSGLEIGTFTISKAPYTVIVNAQDKIYDGSKAATATLSTAGVLDSDDVSLASGYTFAFDNANVGVDRNVIVSGLSLTGTDAANYKIDITYGTASITPKTLTARANGVTKNYDGTGVVDVTFTNISGYADVDSAATVYFTDGKAVASVSNVGTQTLSDITYTLGGSSAGNYVVEIVNLGTATVTILPSDPVVTAPTITGLTYNAARTLASVDLTAYASSDGYWAFDDTSIVPTVNTKKYAATYYPSSSNYNTYSTVITIDVAPAQVVLTADDKVVQYGNAAPTFTVTATGLTGLDTLADIGGTGAKATSTYYVGAPVGSYDINVNYSFDDDNYTFTVGQPGTLIVTPATLTVQATAVNKVYDGNTDVTVNFAIVSGKYGNDDVGLTAYTTVGTAATANAGTTTVTYTAPSLTGNTASNYELYVTPASGVIATEILKADVSGVVFPTEGEVQFGYDLSNATFATAGVGDGTFAYENAKSTVPGAIGVYTNYKVIFTPTDSRNYNTQEAYVTLTVVRCQLDYVVGLSGTAQEGEKLTVVITGMPSLANNYIKYQWYRVSDNAAEAIEGATGASYTAVEDDINCYLVVVTYFDSDAPYVFASYAQTSTVDDEIFGILGQTTAKVTEMKLTFWQRLLRWIYRLIAAITGLTLIVR